MGKTRRKDKDPVQQAWERARDKYDEEAENEMYRRDTHSRRPFHLGEDRITYIASPEHADRTAASILFFLKEDNRDYNYVGFDVEGTSKPGSFQSTPETLQLYTVAGETKRATIFQLNKVATRKHLPRDLEKLLSLKNNVYIGKGVKKEVCDFFREFGIPKERQDNFLFIDTLALIRTCDVFQRAHPEDALEYSTNGTFSTSMDTPTDVYPKILAEAGIRMAVEYFLDLPIDKRQCHVFGPTVDWSAPKGLSQSMLQYAADDVACVYDVLGAAADLLDASRSDFIQASNQEDSFFFLKTNLQRRFTSLHPSTLTDVERDLRKKIRHHHQKKMREETRRAKARSEYKAERCD